VCGLSSFIELGTNGSFSFVTLEFKLVGNVASLSRDVAIVLGIAEMGARKGWCSISDSDGLNRGFCCIK
jgi:hypothetical protein